MLRTHFFPIQGGGRYSNDWGAPRSGGRGHEGTDIFAATGTPIVAVVDGKITAAGDDGGKGGLRIWLNGTYYYAHLSRLAKGLKAGQMVKAGQVIGYVGDSGNAKGGEPHLHFGVDPRGRQSAGDSWTNPYELLKGWEKGRVQPVSEPVTAVSAGMPADVEPAVAAQVEFGQGVPTGPPMPGLPGAELPGSGAIPYREPGSASELWQLISPQSSEGRRFLELAGGMDAG